MSAVTPACSGTKRAPYAPETVKEGDQWWSATRRLLSKTRIGSLRCAFPSHRSPAHWLKTVRRHLTREEDFSRVQNLFEVLSGSGPAVIHTRTTCHYPVSSLIARHHEICISVGLRVVAHLHHCASVAYSVRSFTSIDAFFGVSFINRPLFALTFQGSFMRFSSRKESIVNNGEWQLQHSAPTPLRRMYVGSAANQSSAFISIG